MYIRYFIGLGYMAPHFFLSKLPILYTVFSWKKNCKNICALWFLSCRFIQIIQIVSSGYIVGQDIRFEMEESVELISLLDFTV